MSKKLRWADRMKVFKGYTVDSDVDKIEGGHSAAVIKQKIQGCDTVVFFKAKHLLEDEYRSQADNLDTFRNGGVVMVEGAMLLITVKDNK